MQNNKKSFNKFGFQSFSWGNKLNEKILINIISI